MSNILRPENVKYVFYSLLVFGLIFLFDTSFRVSLQELLYEHRKPKDKSQRDYLDEHLRKVIGALADGQDEKDLLKTFYIWTIALLFIVTLFTFQTLKAMSLVCGIVFAFLPYLKLRLDLALAQRAGSFEGSVLIKEMRNQYRYNYCNMIFAIDATVANLPESERFSKRALMKLSMRLKTYKSEEELEEILDDFRFAFGTKWAKMLTQNIASSIEDHIDVTEGLENLLDICQQIDTKLEKEKQGTIQAAQMTKLLAPALVLLFYGLAIRMLSIKEVMNAQFKTPIGMLVFLLIIISTLVNMGVSTLINHPKYDL